MLTHNPLPRASHARITSLLALSVSRPPSPLKPLGLIYNALPLWGGRLSLLLSLALAPLALAPLVSHYGL